jgi:hypothetical protein
MLIRHQKRRIYDQTFPWKKIKICFSVSLTQKSYAIFVLRWVGEGFAAAVALKYAKEKSAV